jgi:aminoglycoside 6'-N-acetyltransferase
VSKLHVGLRPVVAEDERLLEDWLRRNHVREFWGNPETTLAYVRRPTGGQAIVQADGRDVGYVRWKPMGAAELEGLGLGDLPDGAVDIDILLGRSEWTGQRIGPAALVLLRNDLRAAGAPCLFLVSHRHNRRAHRAFAAAGFEQDRPFRAPRVGPCVLFRDTHPIPVAGKR